MQISDCFNPRAAATTTEAPKRQPFQIRDSNSKIGSSALEISDQRRHLASSRPPKVMLLRENGTVYAHSLPASKTLDPN
eukprot:m.83175 g.83175  ORF g.83175 m.83175 type:complete len:79 (+) comp11178_c0_seq1:113-349(+)